MTFNCVMTFIVRYSTEFGSFRFTYWASLSYSESLVPVLWKSHIDTRGSPELILTVIAVAKLDLLRKGGIGRFGYVNGVWQRRNHALMYTARLQNGKCTLETR